MSVERNSSRDDCHQTVHNNNSRQQSSERRVGWLRVVVRKLYRGKGPRRWSLNSPNYRGGRGKTEVEVVFVEESHRRRRSLTEDVEAETPKEARPTSSSRASRASVRSRKTSTQSMPSSTNILKSEKWLQSRPAKPTPFFIPVQQKDKVSPNRNNVYNNNGATTVLSSPRSISLPRLPLWLVKIRERLYLLTCLVCTVVCLYQTSSFISQYTSYPTSVDVHIEHSNFSDLPAITMCSDRLFDEDMLCNASSQFCNKSDIEEGSPEVKRVTANKMDHFVFSKAAMIQYCGLLTSRNEYFDITKSCVNHSSWVYTGAHSCWSFHRRWIDIFKGNSEHNTRLYIVFVLRLNFTLSRLQQREGILFLHSMYEMPTNTIPGYRIETGYRHKLLFTKTSIQYLEPPYKTMCRNYTRELGSNPSGPHSQPQCIYYCLWPRLKDEIGCVSRNYTIPSGFRACNSTEEDKNALRFTQIEEECKSECPISCLVEMYQSVLTENRKIMEEEFSNLTEIHIELRGSLHYLYNHKPQITNIELFSNLGGYLGVWLGLSVPMAYEYITKCLMIMSGYYAEKLDFQLKRYH